MKQYIFWENTSFTKALALSVIALSLLTSNYYQLVATELEIYQQYNQVSAPESSK